MSALPTIQIQFTPQAVALLDRLTHLDARVLPAIARGMDLANQGTVTVIMRDFLNFPRQGKPTLEGLRNLHNRLHGSVRASKSVIAGNTVTSGIGSNVKYAALHEFGGTVKRVLLAGSVRLRTDKRGNLLRQGKNGKLAVFAKDSHKLATTVAYAGGKRFDAVYPARAPFRRGITRNLEATRQIVSQHIIAALSPTGNGGQP